MGSEGHEHKDNEDEDAERNYNTRKPNADNEPEHNNNEILSLMDKQYGTQSRENMRARKRKCGLPPKMRIHPKINNEVKRSKIHHENMMVYTMGNTNLDLSDFACLHATIRCGTNQQDNMMRDPLVTSILTQYHMSKGLKVFGEPGVEVIRKELEQLHDRVVMDLKNADKMAKCQKKAVLQYLMFLKQKICRKINGRW